MSDKPRFNLSTICYVLKRDRGLSCQISIMTLPCIQNMTMSCLAGKARHQPSDLENNSSSLHGRCSILLPFTA